MIEKDDWRLLRQQEYLKGVTLKRGVFKAYGDSDHAHCEFCWEKFAEFDDCLHEGWTDEKEHYWICDACFEDFKEMFAWKTKETK